MKMGSNKNAKRKGILCIVSVLFAIVLLSLVAVIGIGKEKTGSIYGIRLGLDLAGGVSITYQTVKENATVEELDDTVYKLQRRVEAYSSEAQVYKEGDNRINVDIPGITNANDILAEIGEAGSIQFITEEGEVVIEGSDIQSAEAKFMTNEYKGSDPVVLLTLTSEGSKKFAKATEENVGKTIAIYYDGEEIEAPVVQTKITGGVATISAKSYEEADVLATYIRIGALPLELTEINSKVVGAQLGSEAIKTSLLAGTIGFLLVILFMIFTYRLPGVAASIALCVYVGLIVIVLSVTNTTLTLFGIAGIILSIGMAVDANVIIFTRIREELATGKTVRSSIITGFNKALSAIIDGNVTTLIAAVVLYLKGSGTILGFAQTLAFGIVVSMFTALTVTRFILKAFYNLGADDIKFYGIQKERKNIHFVQNRNKFFTISALLIALGIVFLFVNKTKLNGQMLNYGLDFVGGTSTQITFPDDIVMNDDGIRKIYSDTIGVSATSSKVQGENTFVVKTKTLDLEERTKITEVLVTEYNVDKSTIQENNISASFSSEMRSDAIIAVIITAVCMLLYIWIRFKDLKYGACAVLALIHDVLVTFMIYSVFKITVDGSFIACMLTILGYSINATIVIFDRIRENMKNQMKNESLEDIVDKSITQTISRSINTSLTTFITIAVLFILGIDMVRIFAGPLMVGIICGAYSSVCIAGTLWYFFKTKVSKQKL